MHITACIYYSIASSTDSGETSLSVYMAENGLVPSDLPFAKFYVLSIYWSSGILTGSQTQFMPVATIEQLFAVGMHVLAILVVSVAVDEVKSALNASAHEVRERTELQRIKSYLQHRNIPTELRRDVLRYFKYYYEHGTFDEAEILGSMHQSLRKRVTAELLTSIAKAKLFQGLGPEAQDFETALYPHFHPISFMAGEHVFCKGDRAEALYFVTQGVVYAHPKHLKRLVTDYCQRRMDGSSTSNDSGSENDNSQPGDVVVKIGRGDFFGEGVAASSRRRPRRGNW